MCAGCKVMNLRQSFLIVELVNRWLDVDLVLNIGALKGCFLYDE